VIAQGRRVAITSERHANNEIDRLETATDEGKPSKEGDQPR
jgi:hypothetical protein